MATTNPIAKFIQGSDELNFTIGNLTVRTGTFTPPEYGLTPLISDLSLISIEDDKSRRFNFQIVIQVSSEQEGRFEGRRISDFLRRAGDPDSPLFLSFKPNSDIDFDPTTGQIGAPIFYPIIHGGGSVGEFYSSSDMKTKGWLYNVSLTIHPYALGLPEIFWSATGGIILERKDGRGNGFIVAEASNQKVSNAAFSDTVNAYDNGWTKGSSTVYEKTVKPEHIRIGNASIKIAAIAATNNTLTASINVGNTNIHTLSARVRLIDGGEVLSTHCDLYYNIALTATFTQDPTDSVWWILEEQGVTGINSATDTGLIIKNGYGIIADFVQMEEKAYRTPFFYGNSLGGTWDGTAEHSDSSTRVVGRLRKATDDILNVEQGTIIMAVRMTHAYNDGPFEDVAAVKRTFFADSTTNTKLHIEWATGTSDWRMGDGTNAIDGSADTWSAGDIKIIVGTWSTANGLKLYIGDTTSLDTDSPYASGAYTPVAFQTNGYIGSDSTPAGHHNSTYLAFGIFDRELTATQIQNTYSNMRPQLASGEAVNDIPWLWTSTGNDATANHNDDDAGDDNYFVVGGIPGGIPAEAYISGAASVNWTTFDNLSFAYLALKNTDEVMTKIGAINVIGGSGTVADSTHSFSFYQETTVSTTSILISSVETGYPLATRPLWGKIMYVMMRLYDAGSNLQIRFLMQTGGDVIYSTWKAISTTTAFRWYTTNPLTAPRLESMLLDHSDWPPDMKIGVYAKRTSGSANVRFDHGALMTEPIIVVDSLLSTLTDTGFIIKGRQGRSYTSSGTHEEPRAVLTVKGGPIMFEPQRPGYITANLGSVAATNVIAHTLTYHTIAATPRWELI